MKLRRLKRKCKMCQEMGRKRGQVTCSAECYKMYIESKDSKKIAEFVKSQTEPEK